MKDRILLTSLLGGDVKEAIFTYLDSLPNGTYLCHGDFHPDNILVNDKMWIIDWMTGTTGDKAGDVARTKMLIECSDIPKSIPFLARVLFKRLQKYLSKKYTQKYCRLSGVSTRDINAWLLPVYASHLIESLSEEEKGIILKKINKEMRKISMN